MKKHKILWFFVFTLILTVIIGGVISSWIDESNLDQAAVFVTFAAQMSPAIGLFLVCLLSRDFKVFRNMNWRIGKWTWLCIALLFPVLIVCGAALIMPAMGNPYVPTIYGHSIPLGVIIAASVIGIVGEEIGWRGFMLPAFGQKHSLLLSAVFTGLLWGAWHFTKIVMGGVLAYLLFILLCIEWSVLMAWIFAKTRRSLLPMIAFHFAVNTCSTLLIHEREGIEFYIAAIVISGVLCGIALLKDKTIFMARMERKDGSTP
jgi:membrane protease YdiL (CAAX protease family)